MNSEEAYNYNDNLKSNNNIYLTFVVSSERNSDPLLSLSSSIKQKSFIFLSSLSATGMQ